MNMKHEYEIFINMKHEYETWMWNALPFQLYQTMNLSSCLWIAKVLRANIGAGQVKICFPSQPFLTIPSF